MEPAGAIRGDKNIAHSPLYGSRSGPRRSGISAGGLVFPGIFFALPEQARLQGRAVLPPILWGAGPPQGKSGSGQKSWLRARQPRFASSGILSLRAVLFRGGQARSRACRSVSDGRCPARLARVCRLHREIHRGNRPPGMRKGPRKTGALADVDLSGPQAWDVPVRAASRTGDQPAGRPARRAPGSCRCCDRW